MSGGSAGGPVDLDALEAQGAAQLAGAATLEALEGAVTAVLGKRAPLTGAKRMLGGLDPERRSEVGRQLNEVRAHLEAQAAARRQELAVAERAARLAADRLDLTEVITDDVVAPVRRGHLHLVTTTRKALEDVFVAMGFTVAEGNESETDWYNFGALNMPPAHPARGMYDTMYLSLGR
ncbi:MAG TPA: hypothetical protein VKG43_13000, partial [Acidimicrobiales bacterium]|nr:hypothetical protein [Acidimicrobiales bacterium]